MFIHDRERFGLPPLADFPESKTGEILYGDEYFKFTFVRNPYSRLVSAWTNKLYFIEPGLESLYQSKKIRFPDCIKNGYVTFEGFVRYISQFEDIHTCNPHYRLQSNLVMEKAIRYDMVAMGREFCRRYKRTGGTHRCWQPQQFQKQPGKRVI